MYKVHHIADLTSCSTSVKSYYPMEVSSEKHRPFSYYVQGGTDISGKALALDGGVMFDSEDDLKTMSGTDGLCDPRVGMLDIVERVGLEAFAEAAQAAKDKTK